MESEWEAQEEGAYVCIELIHAVVQQRLTQHSKQLHSNKNQLIKTTPKAKNREAPVWLAHMVSEREPERPQL